MDILTLSSLLLLRTRILSVKERKESCYMLIEEFEEKNPVVLSLNLK